MTAVRHFWVSKFFFCWTHVSVGIFMSRSQPTISHSTPSTQHILLEIMVFFGHLFRAGSCRCCWQLLSWKEVPATPKSKCFCFHFPVLVGFFFHSDVKVEKVFLWGCQELHLHGSPWSVENPAVSGFLPLQIRIALCPLCFDNTES